MRRLIISLAALGLLGALGCHHGAKCWHGRCDCDDTWGCGCCPGYSHDTPSVGAPTSTMPVAIPTTIAPIKSAESLPAPQK